MSWKRKEMLVSQSKIECTCANERAPTGSVRLKGEEIKMVEDF